MTENLSIRKRQSLRNNEYYSMQRKFDELYKKSSENYKFTNLMDLISCRENILLAYRNIKNNKGSKTKGTDGLNIKDFNIISEKKFVRTMQLKFKNYKPKSVRRVEIPKPNGKLRPLGIPCMEDRFFQQCIKQVLEPICEAKFHKHSYGFRPNRSTHHAIARCMSLININKLHYVVDIDIKGFFDNVNHSKLKKQIWNLGIQDKNLISIIGKILKSEIEGIGVPNKGTPQGGIISPLLANIVLNELDWWLSSQYESMYFVENIEDFCKRRRTIKKTKLKEFYFVRYADDFKIFCRDYKTAEKIYIATKNWLKERLDLDVNTDKSKITNLRKNYTEYLGFKLKAVPKKNKFVCKSKMSDKAKQTTIKKFKNQINKINDNSKIEQVMKLNCMILGCHVYYRSATHISHDFRDISFLVRKPLKNRLEGRLSHKRDNSETFKRLYGDFTGKVYTVCGVTIFPINHCRTKPPMCFSQDICNYTFEGREKIHEKLYGNYLYLIEDMLKYSSKYKSIQFIDNSTSLLAGQRGKCYVTGENLESGNMECHHKRMKSKGGLDEYKNLVWLKTPVHKLIHATEHITITKYLEILNLDTVGLKKVNSLRKLVGNSII